MMDKEVKNKTLNADELRAKCKRLEVQYQEFDEAVTKLGREELEHHTEIQKITYGMERLREDSYGDQSLLTLVDDLNDKLRKAESASKELQDTLQREKRKTESETQETLLALHKQIEEYEV